MKSVIFVASIAVLAQVSCLGANQWWVKPGTVNWAAESSYYNNDDPTSVSAKGLPSTGDTIFLSGTFNQTYTLNASTDPASLELINKVLVISPTSSNCNFIVNVEAGDEITLNASVTDFAFGQNDGKGRLTKTGGGTLNLFGMGKVSSDNIYSYYISIDVQGGTVRFPQDLVKANFLARDVHVADGASLWLLSVTNASLGVGSTGFNTLDTLTGSGLVTNTCPELRYLRLSKSCEFGGTLGGNVVVNLFNPNVRFDLTGTNSTFTGGDNGIRLSAEGTQVGLKKLMCDSVHPQGGVITQPSSMGVNHQVRAYAKNTGIVYLGEGGETTWMGLNAQWSPITVDAGAKGGITFGDGREWTGYYGSTVTPSEMQELVLTGSNTETVVFRPYLKCWNDYIAPAGSRTNCTWYVTKRGTGTWYFDTNTRTQWRGGFCLEEGTVQFDKMTEIDTVGPFGLGTMAQSRYSGRWDPASNVTYQIAFGGSTATPRFEYLGSNLVNNATRHIGLNTQGAIVVTGCKRPRTYGLADKEGKIAEADNPFGPPRFRMTGVVSTGGTEEKTLVLDCATNALTTVTDISDGPYGGTVGVTKRGAGNALITGPLTFTGKLKVEKGTLYVNDGAHYRWFKFTPTLTRYADSDVGGANYQTQFAEFALYDKDGNRVNVGMAGEPFVGTFNDYHPFGAGRDYTILTPNQAALGRFAYKNDKIPLTYDQGGIDSAGVISLSSYNSLVSIFDDVAASANNATTFSVYNRTKVSDTDQKSWLSLFMHVKNTVAEVSSYDFAFYKGSLSLSPYSWKFEGSVDGLNWDLLDEQKNHKLTGDADKTTAMNYWSYTNETKTAVQVVAGQVRKGWPVANAPANAAKSDLSKATLEVAAGASLVAEGDFTVGKIEVDASGVGVGTIDNFKLAPTGSLTVRNYEKGSSSTVLPIAFANTDPSVLADWSLNVNGRARPAGSIVVSDEGKVSIIPPGLLLIVR